MKIALVAEVFSPHHGGLERYGVDTAATLLELGCEVHLLARRVRETPPGCHVHLLGGCKHPGSVSTMLFIRGVRRVLADNPMDVVYALNRVYPADGSYLGNGVHVQHMRNRFPRRGVRAWRYLTHPTMLVQRLIEQRMMGPHPPAWFMSPAELVKRRVLEEYAVPPQRIHVIPHGIDTQIFNLEARRSQRQAQRAALHLAQEHVALIFVGNNWPWKGLPVAIAALGRLRHEAPQLRLLVVGRGRTPRARRWARAHGVDDRVIFCGTRREMAPLYAAADALVFPSLDDPFGLVVPEAMACGLPVIVSAAAGASEVVRPGVTGLLQQDPCDAGELAQLIRQLLPAAPRQAMGLAAAAAAAGMTHLEHTRKLLDLMRRHAAR